MTTFAFGAGVGYTLGVITVGVALLLSELLRSNRHAREGAGERPARLPNALPRQVAAQIPVTGADLDRLDEQLASVLERYPCRPDAVCDLHDVGVCAVTRCCPSCSTNPARPPAPR